MSVPYTSSSVNLESSGRRGRHRIKTILLCAVSAASLIIPSALPVQAAIVGSDTGLRNSGDDLTGRVNSAGRSADVIASQNSIALVGDADCNAISGRGLADRTFDPTTIWGNGDQNSTNGIYGFGEQKPLKLGDPGYGDGAAAGPDATRNGVAGTRYYTRQHQGAGQTTGIQAYWATSAPNYAGNVRFQTGLAANQDAMTGIGAAQAGGTTGVPVAGAAQTYATGANAVAIGCDARATGFGAYANGWGAWATGAGANAMGINSRATGQGSLALGIAAQATDNDTIALGTMAQAQKNGGVAVGALTKASGKNSIAIGAGDGADVAAKQTSGAGGGRYGAQATADNAVALGINSKASVNDGAAIGSDSVAIRASGTAGYDAATGASSTQTGPAWVATRGAFSVGDAANSVTRQITGVAAGSEDTDAANIAQLKGLKTYTDKRLADGVTDNAAVHYDTDTSGAKLNTVTLQGGNTANTVTLKNVADGKNASDAVNFGQLSATNSTVAQNTADIKTNTTNIGTNTSDISANKTAIDSNTTAISTNKTTITQNRTDFDAAVKNANTYLGGGADIAAGKAPSYTVQGKTAANVGDAFANVDSTFNTVNETITNNKKDADDKFTEINNNISNGSIGPVRRLNGDDTLSLVNKSGTTDTAQKLTNLADGTDKNDAVNFGQLSATNSSVAQNTSDISANKTAIDSNTTAINTNKTTITQNRTDFDAAVKNANTYLGGGADILAGTAPSYTVQGKTAANVGDAFANVDSSFNTVNDSINTINANINNGAVGPVRRLNDNDVLSLVNKDGKTDTAQKITNLADGTNAADAVNFGQLSATNSTVTQNTKSITDNKADADSRFNTVNQSVSANKTAIDANKTTITQNRTDFDAAVKNANTYLGGGADILAGTAPTYTVQGKSAANVGDAFANVDSTFNTVNETITNNKKDADDKFTEINNNISNGSVGPVRRLSSGDVLTLTGSDGTAGTAQKLTNLADGTDKNDAVNFGQLSATNSTVTQNTADIKTNKTNISANTSDISANKTAIDANKTTITQNRTDFDKSVANTNSYLGGGADILAGTAPTYTVQGKTANNVGGAFANVDSTFNTVNETITNNKKDADDKFTEINNNISNGSVGPVRRLNGDDTLSLVNKDGKTDTTQKLTNLADGEISATSTDAINGKQLSATNNSVAQNTADIKTNTSNISANKTAIDANRADFDKSVANTNSYLGGGANILAGTAPSYTVQGKAANNVGDAFKNVDDNFNTVNNSISAINANINNGTVGPVRRLNNDDVLSLVNKDGKTDTAQRITNLADGNLAKGSTDAVNGSQLFATNENVAKNTQSITDINTNISNITSGKTGPVQRDGDNRLVLTDKDGNKNTPQSLGNVAGGNIAQGSTDAINGGQLFDTNQRVTGVENRVTNVEGRIDQIGSVSKNAVVYDTNADGSRKNSISLQGTDTSTPVALHNVADGAVKKGSKDAVNGGQLQDTKDELNTTIADKANETLKSANSYTDKRIQDISGGSMEEANRYTDRQFGRLNGKINDVRKEARSAAAIGLAAASLRFDDRPGKFSVGVGGGAWRGQGAVSFGAGYTSETGRIRGNVSGTVADNKLGVGGGVTFTLN